MSNEHSHIENQDSGGKLWVVWVFLLGLISGALGLFLMVQFEFLKIPKNESQQSSRPNDVVVENNGNHKEMESEQVTDKNKEETSEPPADTSEVKTTEIVEISKEMRDSLISFDFLKLLQDAEVKRYRFEGETRGVIITKIRTGSIYKKMGIQEGDIIESINGLAFADAARKKVELMQNLPGANQLNLGIRRNGKKILLSVRIVNNLK